MPHRPIPSHQRQNARTLRRAMTDVERKLEAEARVADGAAGSRRRDDQRHPVRAVGGWLDSRARGTPRSRRWSR